MVRVSTDWSCARCSEDVRKGNEDCDLCRQRNARRNAIANALMDAYGWLSLTDRYTAAELAMQEVERRTENR